MLGWRLQRVGGVAVQLLRCRHVFVRRRGGVVGELRPVRCRQLLHSVRADLRMRVAVLGRTVLDGLSGAVVGELRLVLCGSVRVGLGASVVQCLHAMQRRAVLDSIGGLRVSSMHALCSWSVLVGARHALIQRLQSLRLGTVLHSRWGCRSGGLHAVHCRHVRVGIGPSIVGRLHTLRRRPVLYSAGSGKLRQLCPVRCGGLRVWRRSERVRPVWGWGVLYREQRHRLGHLRLMPCGILRVGAGHGIVQLMCPVRRRPVLHGGCGDLLGDMRVVRGRQLLVCVGLVDGVRGAMCIRAVLHSAGSCDISLVRAVCCWVLWERSRAEQLRCVRWGHISDRVGDDLGQPVPFVRSGVVRGLREGLQRFFLPPVCCGDIWIRNGDGLVGGMRCLLGWHLQRVGRVSV